MIVCVWCGRRGVQQFTTMPASMLPMVAELLAVPPDRRGDPLPVCSHIRACTARRRRRDRDLVPA